MKIMKNEMIKLLLPEYIETILEKIEKAGFVAYAVGGCVRDLLRNVTPNDYDIATSASPSDIKKIFPKTVDTGITHGTVSVIVPEGTVEVTTFRRDGYYTDNRRPDTVSFVSDVEEDLARRDFTVNAIAYNPRLGLCDPFSGRDDIASCVLRTVGDPEIRFKEDALRILRLYRFSAQLGFTVEKTTAIYAEKLSGLLKNVSRERIYSEVEKLLGHGNASVLSSSATVLSSIFEGNFDADTLTRVENCSSLPGKWALLCGNKTADVLRFLRAPNVILHTATELSSYRPGKHIVMDVASLRYASADDLFAYLDNDEALSLWKKTIEGGAPHTLSALAISGKEVEEIGFIGKEIGDVLQALFMYAIQNPVYNKKERLKEEAKWMYVQQKSQKE